MLWNCQKVPIFSTFWKKIFLKSNMGALKIFLKSNNLCTKKSVVPTIFLKSRFFLKSGFLKSRAYCIIILLSFFYGIQSLIKKRILMILRVKIYINNIKSAPFNSTIEVTLALMQTIDNVDTIWLRITNLVPHETTESW